MDALPSRVSRAATGESPLPALTGVTPARLFPFLRGLPFPVFLDASLPRPGDSGRSLLGACPTAVLSLAEEGLPRLMGECRVPLPEEPFAALDAFLSGADGLAVGFLSYDLGRCVEGTPAHAVDAERFPRMRWGIYRHLLVYAHDRETWSFRGPAPPPDWITEAAARVSASARAPDRPFRIGPWEPAWSQADHLEAVRRAQDLIRAGEIYQVNLSQRFAASFSGDPWSLYAALRATHPAPYGAYLEHEDTAVLSLSPECLLRVSGGVIRTCPIKGTRPRGDDPIADARAREALARSAKDRAELAMIVDLVRNDLGRVCRTGSVRVTEARRIESYATVHHAVAEVEGVLRPDATTGALLRAVFPGGSITGCPKIRAMQILADLEPWARGLYTGSIGWIAPAGDLILNIAIRTLIVSRGRAVLNVGGGIVADSDPEAEYAETLDKGRAFLSVAR